MYEAMLCGECGHPLSVCRDPAASFEIVEDTCQAKAEIDQYHRANSKNEPEPGHVIAARHDDTPSVAKPPWEV